MTDGHDLIVLGSGPGGYVAALRAAELGLRCLVVEKDEKLGGTCLHRGCIPTKALLHTAELLDRIREASKFGVESPEPVLDLAKAHEYKAGVVDRSAKGIDHLFRRAGVDTLRGTGHLLPDGRIRVEGRNETQELSSRFVLLATGSVPTQLSLAPVDGSRILDSNQILGLDEVPGSLAILGAGAVGVEFASIFTSFGSEVTLIEMLPRVLPIEDAEISAALERALRKRGMRILTDTRATRVESTEHGIRVEIDNDGASGAVEAERLLVAVGRTPRSRDVGLEAAGIEIDDRGFVRVDQYRRTARANVYAIGDLLATPQLAHLASAEGILAVEDMAGLEPRPIDLESLAGLVVA